MPESGKSRSGFFYPRREYLRPWKLVTFIAGTAVMVLGSFYSPAPDWDVGISLIMPTLTYVTAPCAVRVLIDRNWRLLSWALAASWFSVDGAYTLYWHLQDPIALEQMRTANAQASLPLYGLCGMFWFYRGSLKDLVGEVRAAFAGSRRG